MPEPLIHIEAVITQETKDALNLMAAEAGFHNLQEYLQFRINTDLRDWRYHLDTGQGIPPCNNREGRPAPQEIFQAFPREKQCPECRQIMDAQQPA